MIRRIINMFKKDKSFGPEKNCKLFTERGCVHINTRNCEFPSCWINNTYQNIDKLHAHPQFEKDENLSPEFVIVDDEFRCLFSDVDAINNCFGLDHIIVKKSEYEYIKYGKK